MILKVLWQDSDCLRQKLTKEGVIAFVSEKVILYCYLLAAASVYAALVYPTCGIFSLSRQHFFHSDWLDNTRNTLLHSKPSSH